MSAPSLALAGSLHRPGEPERFELLLAGGGQCAPPVVSTLPQRPSGEQPVLRPAARHIAMAVTFLELPKLIEHLVPPALALVLGAGRPRPTGVLPLEPDCVKAGDALHGQAALAADLPLIAHPVGQRLVLVPSLRNPRVAEAILEGKQFAEALFPEFLAILICAAAGRARGAGRSACGREDKPQFPQLPAWPGIEPARLRLGVLVVQPLAQAARATPAT